MVEVISPWGKDKGVFGPGSFSLLDIHLRRTNYIRRTVRTPVTLSQEAGQRPAGFAQGSVESWPLLCNKTSIPSVASSPRNSSVRKGESVRERAPRAFLYRGDAVVSRRPQLLLPAGSPPILRGFVLGTLSCPPLARKEQVPPLDWVCGPLLPALNLRLCLEAFAGSGLHQTFLGFLLLTLMPTHIWSAYRGWRLCKTSKPGTVSIISIRGTHFTDMIVEGAAPQRG